MEKEKEKEKEKKVTKIQEEPTTCKQEVQALQKELNILKNKEAGHLETIQALQLELEAATKVREELIDNEYHSRGNIDRVNEQKNILTKENTDLKNTLNHLANMFDECFQAFKDFSQMFGTIDRNAKYALRSIEQSLEEFNNPNKKE